MERDSEWQYLFGSKHPFIGAEMNVLITILLLDVGGAVAQSIERTTPGEEVPGSIPAVAARYLLVGSVSV